MRLLSDKTGFGNVYEAYERDKPKILKVLKADLNRDTKAVELFQQEANVLQQLNHPGIPKVEQYFQYTSRNSLLLHCIVMEKIEGPDLEAWLRQQQNRPITEDQAVAWLKQLAQILVLVHGKQYLHRDIKPSNIMIRPDGQLVLIDFGTARELTRTYLAKVSSGAGITSISSSGYSAMEQMNGQALPQSDFFSLGRTFVFLLTGYQPTDMYDSYHNVLHWRNHATHVSPQLLNFVDWLMMREVGKRPANAQEIIDRLCEFDQTSKTGATVNIGVTPPVAAIPSTTTTTTTTTNTNTTTTFPSTGIGKKPALLALLTALLFSLGILGAIALTTGNPKGFRIPSYGQKPRNIGKVDYFPYQPGRDSKGRIAEFNIAVLSVEYKWLLGSSYQIKHNDQVISLDGLRSNLEQEGIQKIMENPNELISVGTASCEGDLNKEESRALERSKQIQLLVKKVFSNSSNLKGYRLLNLGQFVRSDCQANQDSTAYQRSIIIIGVKKQSEGVILDEALRDRLERKPFADFVLDDYSLGSQEKFKTTPSNL
jgi:serine/threonine protein kinase